MGELEPQQLAPADPGVGERPHEGLVAAADEAPVALADGEQGAELGLPEDGRWFLRQPRWLHAVHRAVPDLAFLDQPPEERMGAPVAVVGGGRLPAL